MTSPSMGPCQWSSTAFAMAAEALPAPRTIVRPLGGGGRCFGTTLSGSAASTAASNIALSRSRCCVAMMILPFPSKMRPFGLILASGSIRAGRGFRRRPVLRHQDRLDLRQMVPHGIPGARGITLLQCVEDTDMARQSRPLVLRQPRLPAQTLEDGL